MVKNDTPRFGSGPRVVPNSKQHNEEVMHPRNQETVLDIAKLVEQLGPDLEGLDRAPLSSDPHLAALAHVPSEKVKQFVDLLNKQFTQTADFLHEDIKDLERILGILRNRENTLRTAASEVGHNIETWVAYERETHRITSSLDDILKKGGHRVDN